MDISAAELSRLGLTAQALAQQVAASDAKVAAGQYRSDGREFLLEVDSALDSLEQIRTIPIQVGGSGQVAQLGDIATVTKGIQDPATDLAYVNGHPAIVPIRHGGVGPAGRPVGRAGPTGDGELPP